jgi:hypothetical protein
MPRSIRNPLLLLLVGLLAGCASTPPEEDWPQHIPERSCFIELWRADAENREAQDVDEYLTWVVRFYEGLRPIALPWRDITTAVVADLEGDQRAEALARMERLGLRISAEWAKENELRVIDTGMLSVWGAVMLGVETPERIAAMDMISRDVRGLLDESITPDSITEWRYEEALGVPLAF